MNCCSYGITHYDFKESTQLFQLKCISFLFFMRIKSIIISGVLQDFLLSGKTENNFLILPALLHILSNHLLLFLFTVKYKLPSALFSSHLKINSLWSALEGFPGEGLEVPEACGLHPSPEVSIKWVGTSFLTSPKWLKMLVCACAHYRLRLTLSIAISQRIEVLGSSDIILSELLVITILGITNC